VIEIGTKRSRLVLALILIVIGVFLLQVLMYYVNPAGRTGPYFGPQEPSAKLATWRVEAPDPLTQLLWLSVGDAIGLVWLWQFLTFGFAHSAASAWHLIIGLAGIWMFGPEVEERLGSRRFLFLYFSSTALCGLVSMLLLPRHPTMGCLAAALAVAGAFWHSFGDSAVYITFLQFRGRKLALGYAAVAALVCVAYLPDALGVVCVAHIIGLPYGWIFCRFEKRFGWYLILWELRRADRRAAKERKLRAHVDRLLAKVQDGGLNKLSFRERAFLRLASRKFQQWRVSGDEVEEEKPADQPKP